MNIHIRPATIADLDPIRHLFFDTVTTVNAAHYNAGQVKVWSAGYENIERWTNRILEQHFFVADIESTVAGFASLTNEGYLDVFFVHKDFQRRGVARGLINYIYALAQSLGIRHITSDVSITARPFFEKHGFAVVAPQLVELKGIMFDNFKMECLV